MGRKAGAMATGNQRPTLWPSEKPVHTLRGRIRSNWEETRGEASRGMCSGKWQAGGWSHLRPRALSLLYKTWFAIFGRAKAACQSLVPQRCPLPQALGSSSSCSLMLYWGDYVFLLTITFPRDRGGQRCDQKAFILPCIPADARLSPQKRTSSQSPAGTNIDH